ncbi:MAG: hypothetical protein KGD73_12860, partial [Candidatus Lokiarchaeota archaeon]|nr:hypothetical protein [Candidatus Lokiarchaeota archaeon]
MSFRIINDYDEILSYMQIGTRIPLWSEFHKYIIFDLKYFKAKSILLLGKQAKYKRILTGSPVTKSPLDLYTQCGFLNSFLLG